MGIGPHLGEIWGFENWRFWHFGVDFLGHMSSEFRQISTVDRPLLLLSRSRKKLENRFVGSQPKIRKASKFRVWGSLRITHFHPISSGPISENVHNILMYICAKFGACITKRTILLNIWAKPWHYATLHA